MSVIKHTDPVPDPRAVNQDKKNMLFSVSSPGPAVACSSQEPSSGRKMEEAWEER